jgi:hypothetical protein
MIKRTTITFPLEHPTHYLACISNDATGDCTHVSIKLSAPTLIRLVWLWFVASTLRLIGVKISVFDERANRLAITCLSRKGNQALKINQETSADDDPYNCRSAAELISLGGYATESVLGRYFTLANKDLKLDSVEVHIASRMMWLKLYFIGANPSTETDPFNLGIIVKDFIRHNLLKGGRYVKTIK